MDAEALSTCPWLCSAPLGPGTPFQGPVFLVIDSLRILIVIASIALIALSLWAMHRSHVLGQKCRFAFAAFMCVGALGTEIDRLGDWPHWRFIVNLAGITLGLWGYYQHLFREHPAQERTTRQDPSP